MKTLLSKTESPLKSLPPLPDARVVGLVSPPELALEVSNAVAEPWAEGAHQQRSQLDRVGALKPSS